MMRYVPVLAVVMTAAALYVSRGVLDQTSTADGSTRVALLPPWAALVAFAAMGALGVLWLHRRALPRASATAVRPPIGPLVVPTLLLGVLLLPYLPWIPDAMPQLQMLAGPLRAVIWLVVIAQFGWVLWQARLLTADWLGHRTVAQMALVVAVATALVSGVAAARLTHTALYPAGDEPHYLIIAQSLWRDGDLKIENNHQRGDYREYFQPDLAPHYVTRGSDQEIYSIHPVGLPALVAPVYAMAGYRGVVFGIVLMAAAAAGLMWRSVVRATNTPGAATFGWAAVAMTTPFLYNSFAVYPEVAAGLAAVIALTWAAATPASAKAARWLPVGLASAALPWLSTKYAPMSAVLVLVACARLAWPAKEGRAARLSVGDIVPGTFAVIAPYALSLAAWFWFFYAIWGVPLPQAPYGALVQTTPFNLVFGAPGLLFDQEYGLLAYAPVYILAGTGLWAMWREGGDLRRRGWETALTVLALLGTVGAFRIWWGGSASPGRPMVSGLLLLALPMAVAFRASPAGSARRATQHLLLWLSIGVAAVMGVAQEGSLINNGRDGSSGLLEYLSPRWPAWSAAPSFIQHEAPTAMLHAAAWLALAAAAALVLGRVRTPRPGVASAAALAGSGTVLLAAALLVPVLPADPAWPALDLRARARLPLLDSFDTVTRPIGIEYTPFRVTSASTLATHVALHVDPDSRAEPQPLRVIHNGRVSLPAGRYRLVVEWAGQRQGESIGLQVGRTGEPWRTWPVDAQPGEHWSMEVDLPLDASFVGLRGSTEIERAIAHITWTPISVVEASKRPRLPTVMGASQSGGSAIFHYDENAFQEATGFWVRGGRTTRLTIHRRQPNEPLRLRVHSGLIANLLRLSMPGWTETRELMPLTPVIVDIPAGDRALVTLELSNDHEFVPMVLDAASSDHRPLGVWVEVLGP
ncbi:MAG: hypothetical protein ACT4QD_27140 [Acidobacteriota bacterium]